MFDFIIISEEEEEKIFSIISTMTQKVTVNGKLNLEVEDEEHFSSKKIIL